MDEDEDEDEAANVPPPKVPLMPFVLVLLPMLLL